MLGFPWMPRDRLRKFTCFCEDFTARGVLAETLPARTGLITWGPPSIREAGGARERVPWLSQKRPARPRSVVPAPLPCVFALFAWLTFRVFCTYVQKRVWPIVPSVMRAPPALGVWIVLVLWSQRVALLLPAVRSSSHRIRPGRLVPRGFPA